MKVLLDIPDHKAASLIEVLGGISYVKTQTLTPYKAQVLEDLKEAVLEVSQIKAGKKKGQPLNEFLDEL